MNKRAVNASAASGGGQNSGTVREAATASAATVLPQPTTAPVGKGKVAVQDKAGKCCLYLIFGFATLCPSPNDCHYHFPQEPRTQSCLSIWVDYW